MEKWGVILNILPVFMDVKSCAGEEPPKELLDKH